MQRAGSNLETVGDVYKKGECPGSQTGARSQIAAAVQIAASDESGGERVVYHSSRQRGYASWLPGGPNWNARKRVEEIKVYYDFFSLLSFISLSLLSW